MRSHYFLALVMLTMAGCAGSAPQWDANIQLRDPHTLQPIIGARVEINRLETPPLLQIYFAWNDHGLEGEEATTGAGGQTHFAGPLDEGIWSVRIDAPGYELAQGQIDVEAKSPSDLWRSGEVRRLYPLNPDKYLEYRLVLQKPVR